MQQSQQKRKSILGLPPVNQGKQLGLLERFKHMYPRGTDVNVHIDERLRGQCAPNETADTGSSSVATFPGIEKRSLVISTEAATRLGFLDSNNTNTNVAPRSRVMSMTNKRAHQVADIVGSYIRKVVKSQQFRAIVGLLNMSESSDTNIAVLALMYVAGTILVRGVEKMSQMFRRERSSRPLIAQLLCSSYEEYVSKVPSVISCFLLSFLMRCQANRKRSVFSDRLQNPSSFADANTIKIERLKTLLQVLVSLRNVNNPRSSNASLSLALRLMWSQKLS